MARHRFSLPPHIKHGLLAFIVFLVSISVARLLVSMHRMQEQIDIMSLQIEQLMADTSRLQIAPLPQPNYSHGDRPYYSHYHRSGYKTPDRQRPSGQQPAQTQNTQADSTTNVQTVPTQSSEENYPHKFTEPHRFDLNTIDSLTLIRIPGIAARTASVILKQRQRYGGFHSPSQLAEFLTWQAAQDYMDEWCTLWFTADAQRLRPIAINTATISELQRHPYISHEQAVDIANYRRRHKRIASATELQQLSSFSTQSIELLLPYLSFQ